MLRSFLMLCVVLSVGASEVRIADNIILPQRHVIRPPDQVLGVVMRSVDAEVSIRDLQAETTLRITVENNSSRPQEAELLLPVPHGCVVTGVHYDGLGSEPTARILPLAEARRIYEAIVSRMKDPALLEFAGASLIRTSVFPVPAHARQVVEVRYEQLLDRHGERTDYRLPRSSDLGREVPWTMTVNIQDAAGITQVYSTTHTITSERMSEQRWRAQLNAAKPAAGTVQISWVTATAPVPVMLSAYPDVTQADTGWFLATIAAPPPEDLRVTPRPRSLQIVIDRSGSMRDGQLTAVRAAVQRLLETLRPHELINIMVYHHGVERFAPEPVQATNDHRMAIERWLSLIEPRGGTNIQAAVLESLRQPVPDTHLPVVVFLTDGLATVGETKTTPLRKMIAEANQDRRRLFTIGVGNDLDPYLIEQLAYDARGTATFIPADADISGHLDALFGHLQGPVLTDCELEVYDADGRLAPGRLLDVEPQAIRDVFAGQRRHILGRYIGNERLTLVIKGQLGDGKPYQQQVVLDPQQASFEYDAIPRLWASRRIAALVDAVRALGADGEVIAAHDPRMKELVEEIVQLSSTYGVLTEYTAFLAEEPGGQHGGAPQPATVRAPVTLEAERRLREWAVEDRTGAGAVRQSTNSLKRRELEAVSEVVNFEMMADAAGKVTTFDADEALMNQVAGATTSYQFDGRWVEGRLADRQAALNYDRTIAFGSEEYFELVMQLVSENRQGLLARSGDVVIKIKNQVVLVTAAKH